MTCKNKGLTEKSIEAMCHVDMPLFLRFIGNKELKDTTNLDVEDFLYYCQNERNNQSCTLGRKYTSLNSFYKTLIKKQYLKDFTNPLDLIDKIKVRKKVRGYLTEEEINKMLAYVDSVNDLRGGCLISLLFSSGIRLSEVHQLNKNSFDQDKKQFVVLGKGNKERICIYSEDARQRILKYINSRADSLECLFVSREKKRWSSRSIQRYLKNVAIKAGIEQNVFPHLIRHTTAMTLLHNNIPLDKIQKVLGHESVATTQIYAYNTIDDVQNSIEGIFDNYNGGAYHERKSVSL